MKRNGFTIVELLIGIIIFTVGMLSAYILVYSALASSTRSRDEIIVGNIGREKIELVRNMRDTNWLKNLDWNKLDSAGSIGNYMTGGYFKIENEFSVDIPTNNSIKISKLSSSFVENKNYIFSPAITSDATKLCLDSKLRYTYDCSGANKDTNIYSFLKIEPLATKDTTIVPGIDINVNDAIKITSINYTSGKNGSEYRISTILTNWKK